HELLVVLEVGDHRAAVCGVHREDGNLGHGKVLAQGGRGAAGGAKADPAAAANVQRVVPDALEGAGVRAEQAGAGGTAEGVEIQHQAAGGIGREAGNGGLHLVVEAGAAVGRKGQRDLVQARAVREVFGEVVRRGGHGDVDVPHAGLDRDDAGGEGQGLFRVVI